LRGPSSFGISACPAEHFAEPADLIGDAVETSVRRPAFTRGQQRLGRRRLQAVGDHP
jgi:hypothetical protein